MSESRGEFLTAVVGVLVLAAATAGLSGCAGSTGGAHDVAIPDEPARVLPWEWWRDLATIASVPSNDRVVMRSSHCPTGCAYDRHSEGDSRFLRKRRNGEGVVFEAEGAGAVTRIWMVMGDGISKPLDPGIRLRVRIDGRRRPVVDVPLPALFDGSTPPFVAPLVADLNSSGGGNVSYVPIPFRKGCEISLVGAEKAKIWFQVTARLVDDPTGIRSYTGDDDLQAFRTMLGRVGKDPWQDTKPPAASGFAVLTAGASKLIATLDGPDFINGIVIRAHRKNWCRLGLRLTFDDRDPQLIPLLDLMGVMRPDGGTTGSLLMGADGDGDLYCYFPMPFFERATVELMRRPVEGPTRCRVEYAVRTAGRHPPDNAGIFRVQVHSYKGGSPGQGITLLENDGGGKLVGLVEFLRRSRDRKWAILEGDEWMAINGETNPSWIGTGVEDFFNGGFYFRNQEGVPTPFTTALAGAPFILRKPATAVMYRLMLGDAVVFADGIRAGLEIGPTGELDARARTVAYLYSSPQDGETARAEDSR